MNWKLFLILGILFAVGIGVGVLLGRKIFFLMQKDSNKLKNNEIGKASDKDVQA